MSNIRTLLHETTVTTNLQAAHLTHTTQHNTTQHNSPDVQQMACLLDVTRVCELKENIYSTFGR